MVPYSPNALSRSMKRVIYFATDTLLIPIGFISAVSLRYGSEAPSLQELWPHIAILMCLGAIIISAFGLPKIKLHTIENRAIFQITYVAAFLALVSIVVNYAFEVSDPHAVPLIFGAIFFLSSTLVRLFGQTVIGHLTNRDVEKQRVLIYGAGGAGIQLASALSLSREAKPVVFVDDNSNLHGLLIAGLPVYAPEKIEQLLKRHQITNVLLALPTVNKERIAELTHKFKKLGVEAKALPSYVDMMTSDTLQRNGRQVSPDELLGRSKIALDIPQIAKTYAGRVVMVTGAGGSIGSELCRQLIYCAPARIVLFELSEYQLYKIDREIRPLAEAEGIEITTLLGSVTDRTRVENVIAEEQVEVILHAAAYKHVPIVEENELEGVKNNVLGTQVVAEAAAAAEIERFILVSTDKAVRPTNVMGASKRMAELVVQDIQTRHPMTKFTMVRFGNVLGSSGSVLPLFQKQIEAGGPVTVTHAKVTRFFMTIPEASRLVLLAGAFASGGDVFVLDMGKPQKIIDIAKRMIELSGRTLRDAQNGKGDIAIKIVGLRPGEKLYEELLIDNDSLVATPHRKIMRAEEKMLSQIEVLAFLREIQSCISDCDSLRLRNLIANKVEGYHVQEPDNEVPQREAQQEEGTAAAALS